MIQQPHRLLDRLGTVPVFRRRALDQHDGQAEDACGDHLRIGGLAAGILADDDVDAVLLKQRHLRLDREGTAGKQVIDIGRGERRIDGIDAAHEIMMLRGGIEGLRLLPADGEEDPSRFCTQRRNGFGHRGDARPAVALRLVPAEPLQPDERDAGCRARGAGIGGNLPREGMGRVDHEIDGLIAQIGGEPFGAAEAAGAHRHRLRRGIERAAGERQREGKVGPAGEAGRKVARLAGAAQYEDASLVHA